MLIRFVVTNFLSFKEETEFNMLTGNFKIHGEHVYENKHVEVLKAASIYGANGAGKSNLIKAVYFLKNAISKGKVSTSGLKHKTSENNLSKPTDFEIEFISNGAIYNYGLSIDETKVINEWLVKIEKPGKEETIFDREVVDGTQTLKLHKRYLHTTEDQIRKDLYEKEFLVTDELFISIDSKLKENKIKEITEVYNWINNNLVIVFPHSKPAYLVAQFLMQKQFKDFSNHLLCGFDTGIKELRTDNLTLEQYFGEDDKSKSKAIADRLNAGEQIIPIPSATDVVAMLDENRKPVIKKLCTVHRGDKGQEVKFDLSEESDGTKRLIDFIPALYSILFLEAVVIIDEIDRSIHPYLLKSLIRKVMDEKNTNGQLIFTTHESNLLDLEIFRQDEIWFAEKDHAGSTKLYSMSEYKPRYDFDIRKGYLNGRFGAIPFLGNLTDLKWEQYEKEEQGV